MLLLPNTVYNPVCSFASRRQGKEFELRGREKSYLQSFILTKWCEWRKQLGNQGTVKTGRGTAAGERGMRRRKSKLKEGNVREKQKQRMEG